MYDFHNTSSFKRSETVFLEDKEEPFPLSSSIFQKNTRNLDINFSHILYNSYIIVDSTQHSPMLAQILVMSMGCESNFIRQRVTLFGGTT